MNEKQIELLKKELNFLEKEIEHCVEVDKYLYNNSFEDLRGLFPLPYALREKKDQLQKKLKAYELLAKNNIDVNKHYYLFDDVYLSIQNLNPFFYIEDGQWIYSRFIGSWSGINEWITDLIDSEYAIFSGNSQYSHAFGTASIKQIFKIINSEETDPEEKVQLLINLIEFTKEDGRFKGLREKVVKMIKFRFDMMKGSENSEKTY